MNTVHKIYVSADENRALEDTVKDLAFGDSLADLIIEFNQNQTLEAQLAHDADQLALILDLKALSDIGYNPPDKWLPPIIQRLQTEVGKILAQKIMNTEWDAWWIKNCIDRNDEKK